MDKTAMNFSQLEFCEITYHRYVTYVKGVTIEEFNGFGCIAVTGNKSVSGILIHELQSIYIS